MHIEDRRRFLDDEGHPIDELYLSGDSIRQISIKSIADGLEVRTLDEDGDESRYDFELTGEEYRGATGEKRTGRWSTEEISHSEVDDSILMALQVTGHTLVHQPEAEWSPMSDYDSERESLFDRVDEVKPHIGAESFETVASADSSHRTTSTKEWLKEESQTEWLLSYEGARLLINFALDHRDERGETYTMTEMAEKTGVARQTLYKYIDRVVEAGVLEKAGSHYAINEDSPILEVYSALNYAIGQGRGSDPLD